MIENTKRLLLVRPNLGNPLILTPTDLKKFTVTIAYKFPWKADPGTIEWPTTSPGGIHSFYLQLRSNSYFGIKLGNHLIPLKILKVHDYSKHPFFEDDYKHMIHPITSLQQQYANGFRWEVKVDVGLDDHRIDELRERTGGLPALLDIESLFDRTQRIINHHAIYVHESLKDSAEFTILHITDTHIAKRNDLIPEILCKVRNKSECDDLKKRYINFNDNLRAFIKEANKRIESGENVIVVLTGDITDYYFDGYWDGKFVCGQGIGGEPGWPDRRKKLDGSWNSNMLQFIEIITGEDSKIGALKCPIFTILGNHDYYANEILLNYYVGSSAADAFTDAIAEREDYGAFFKFNSDNSIEAEEVENCAREYDFWAYPRMDGKKHMCFGAGMWWVYTDSIAIRKTFKEVIRSKHISGSELKCLRQWRANLVDFAGDKSYWLIKPKSWILSQYLCQINYDLDYDLQIGNSKLLLLNTGHDRFPNKEQMLDKFPLFAYDFIEEGGVHARGITRVHHQMLKTALSGEGERLIFVFTHAPLFQIRKLPEEKEIQTWYEDTLANASPEDRKRAMEILTKNYSDLWEWLSEHGKAWEAIREAGSFLKPNLPKGCFKEGYRSPSMLFYSAEGCKDKKHYDYWQLADQFLSMMARQPGQSTDKPVLVFSGHTHKIHQFRIEKFSRRGNHFYFYTDNYADKVFQDTDNSIKIIYRYGYLKVKSPLLMTSGGLKNKDPQYREIKVHGLSIASLQMIDIPPLEDQEITADFSPGCFMIYLRAHNGQYVCAEEGGKKELMADRNLAREWETFEIVKLEGNQVALKACNGKFVRAIGGGGGKLKADRNWIKSHETFTLVRRGRNKIALKAHNDKFVCAEGGGGRELLANRDWAREWETFTISGELAGF